MSRSAVLVGRTTSDVLNNVLVIVVMSLTGLVVGWRIRTSLLEAVAASCCCCSSPTPSRGSWPGWAAGPDTGGRAERLLHRDLPDHLHRQHVRAQPGPAGPLRLIAEWNPVSAVTQAARELFGNVASDSPVPDVWSLQNPVLYTLIWVAIILAVFIPLSLRQYRLTTSR
jgi:hypothetical protein